MPAQPAEFHISSEEIRAAVSYPSLITAFEAMHKEEAAILEDSLLTQPGTGEHPNRFIVRTAWQRGVALGTKMGSVFQAIGILTCR